MGVVKLFRKASVERRLLYIDYSCFLEDTEKLTDFQATVIPYTVDNPLFLDVGYTDVEHKKLAMYAAGGMGNQNYTIQMVVRTDNGQTKRDDIGIRVTP